MIDLRAINPNELAILGAGISLDPPTNLLDGASFMRNVLASAAPADLDRSWVMSALDLPAGLCRPGERLRFEVLMHLLVDQGLDPDLTVLDCGAMPSTLATCAAKRSLRCSSAGCTSLIGSRSWRRRSSSACRS